MPKVRRKPAEIAVLAETAGTSKIKKKIRDLERLLRKQDLAPTKRVETERAVTALKQDLVHAETTLKTRTLAKKYHMVRFFEKKKAMRHLVQAVKKLAQDPESTEAQEAVSSAETDWYYVTTFPLDRKYVALFASEERTDVHNEALAEIKTKIADGTYPSGVKNGKSVALASSKE